MYYYQNKFTFNLQVNLSKKLFESYLRKPYTFHLQINTSILLRNINSETTRVCQLILTPILILLSEILVILGIIILLIFIEPLSTLVILVVLGGSLGLFFKFFRKKIKIFGEKLQYYLGGMFKWVNQGLGAKKEVKTYRREKFFVDSYTRNSEGFAKSARFHEMMNRLPRLFIETLIMTSMILVVIIIILQNNDISKIIPTLALFAFAAIRLIPSMNRIGENINNIIHTKPALDVIYKDIVSLEEKSASIKVKKQKIKQNKYAHKRFTKSIDFINVSYHYPGTKEYVLKNISLSIPIGKSVAFFGPSGIGKTTIADILLGLLPPDKGKIIADDMNIHENLSIWSKKVGYIPQFLYLCDDTIRRNVAFGIKDNDIDDTIVWEVLAKAQLKKYIEKLPKKLDTIVGELGIRLSGGQRQRIGIARAIYHNPEILVLDEATSSLDKKTEIKVMDAVYKLHGQKTIIIISHNINTIDRCDIIFNIKNGSLITEKRLQD